MEEIEEEELDEVSKAAKAIVDMSLFLTTKVGILLFYVRNANISNLME